MGLTIFTCYCFHRKYKCFTSNVVSIQLSEPFKIFEFDFWKRPDSHGETEIWVKAIDDGKVHAIISW